MNRDAEPRRGLLGEREIAGFQQRKAVEQVFRGAGHACNCKENPVLSPPPAPLSHASTVSQIGQVFLGRFTPVSGANRPSWGGGGVNRTTQGWASGAIRPNPSTGGVPQNFSLFH